MPASPAPERAATRFVWPVVACAVGLLVAFHPTLLSAFARIQTDVGDTRFNNFILEHGYRWITGRTPSFWDAPFFFPVRNAAAYSDTLLGAAPIYWLWRVVGFLPDTAFQLWQLSVSVLNFAVFYWFLRRNFAASVVAAIAGAELFAFGGPRLAQTMHIQLFPQFFSIIVLHSLLQVLKPELFARQARKHWALMAGAFVFQLYASYYLAWFLFFGIFLSLLWRIFSRDSRQHLLTVLRRDAGSIALVSAVALVAIAPMVIHYVQASRATGLRPWFSVYDLLPRPLSWFAGDTGSWFYAWTLNNAWMKTIPLLHEQSLTFGYLTTAVCTWGLWRNRHQPLIGLMIRVWLTLIVLTTLWWEGGTLWQSIWAVFPGANALRAVARIILLISIPASIGVALTVDALRSQGRVVVAVLVAVLCLLEQAHTTPSFSKAEVRARIVAEVRQVPQGCDAFYLSPEMTAKEQPDWLIQVDAMWVAIEVGVPTLNGYSGNHPKPWPLKDSVILSPADETRLSEALKSWNATHGLGQSRICWARYRG